MPKKQAAKKNSREFAQAMARAIINRDKFHNLKQLKPGQARWQHQRAISLSQEFEELADDETWVEFWTRANVVRDIEAGDVVGVFQWMNSKIWWMDFRKRQKEERERVENDCKEEFYPSDQVKGVINTTEYFPKADPPDGVSD